MTEMFTGPGGREVWRVLRAFPPPDVCDAKVLPVLHRQLQAGLHREDRSRRHAGRAHADRWAWFDGRG